jgi:plastocyanin
VPLSEDIAPGTYHYYCNWHFVEMSGAIEVVPDDVPIPAQSDVNKAANQQTTRYTDELAAMFAEARAGKRGERPVVGVEVTAEELRTKYGRFPAIGNEFVPSTIEADVGEAVTWTFRGRSHSVAFNVPRYFPVVDVTDRGTVTLDQRGFKAVREPVPPDQAAAEAGAGGPPPGERRPPVAIDGGRFDGSGGLRSSGMFFAEGDTFSVTFTKPGTYLFACIVHPAMVGKVVVR